MAAQRRGPVKFLVQPEKGLVVVVSGPSRPTQSRLDDRQGVAPSARVVE